MFAGESLTGDLTGLTATGASSCGTASSADAWYAFTAPCPGVVTIDTVGSINNGGPDTVLSLHSGCPGDLATEHLCDDGLPEADAQLIRTVDADETTVIRVSAQSAAPEHLGNGMFTLNVSFAGETCGCRCNGSNGGPVDITDLLEFLQAWFSLEQSQITPGTGPDYTADGTVDVLDLLAYLACWFAASDTGVCP